MNSMGPPPLKSTERPPLITPSASPPPSRFTHRNPDSDGPSPTKRQRFFSTPRLTLPESSASSSVSRPQTPVDVQKEREASKLRLLDVWANIAARYKVPVEDDDLVNIRTGKITKDNGFLRRHKTLDFGMIAAPTSGSDDEGSEEDEEDEYDVDELDAFADENSNLGDDEDTGLQTGFKPPANANPFVSIIKAAEEEDLRQFMKAEQERKALCGSDVDDYEDGECSSEEYASSLKPDGETESDVETSAEPDFDDEEPCLEQEIEAGEEHEPEGSEEQVYEEQTHGEDLAGTVDQPIPLDLDSDDELDNWNEDEASIVYPVVKSEPPEDHIASSEEDEPTGHPGIIREVPVVVKSSDNQNKPTKTLSRPKSIKNSHQLYTPPQSQSSSRSSAAPIIEVIDLSSSTESSPPPSASIAQKSSKTQSKPSNSKIPIAFQHKPLQKTNKNPTISKETTTTPAKLPAKPNKTTPKPKPYILLTPRNVSSSGKAQSDLPSLKTAIQTDRLPSEDDFSEHANSGPTKASKGKGKAKAMETEIGPQSRKSDKTRHVSSGPSSDVRRVSTRAANATTPSNEGDGGSTRTSSDSKTKSGVQDHKIPSSSKTSSKDTKRRTEKSLVASNHESSSTHQKRKRTSLNSTSSSPVHNFDSEKRSSNLHNLDRSSKHASTSRVTLDEERMDGKAKKGASSRRRETSSSSDSDTGLEADSSASESEGRFRRNKLQPQVRPSVPPTLHPYHHMPYPPSHYPPQDYPPIPDPRAQLIITHAMHQLSALVGGSWGSPHYGDGAIPYTPTHRHHDGRASVGPFLTPTHHPHPYPYAYDPNYSNATLPPDSSEIESSPHKQSSGRRKSIVKRSQSRGRRVSFRVDEEERSREVVGGRSSPSPKEKGRKNDSRGSSSKKSKLKGRENVQERHEESSDAAELDYESDGASKEYVRGRTPGPSSD